MAPFYAAAVAPICSAVDSSPEVIRLAVMMYIRCPLSLRQVEDLRFERGIDICHETVRSDVRRRDRRAALKFLKRRMKRYGRPRSMVTDRLRWCRSAMLPIRSAVGGSTIEPRIPTSRSDDENERWRSSEM